MTDEEIIDLVKNVTGWTIHFKTSFDPLGHFYSVASNKASVQQIIDIARALLSASKPAAPEGWKLVPVEPTDDMQLAGAESVRFETTAINKIWTANKAYRAMLAASPAAPAQSGEPSIGELKRMAYLLKLVPEGEPVIVDWLNILRNQFNAAMKVRFGDHQ